MKVLKSIRSVTKTLALIKGLMLLITQLVHCMQAAKGCNVPFVMKSIFSLLLEGYKCQYAQGDSIEVWSLFYLLKT